MNYAQALAEAIGKKSMGEPVPEQRLEELANRFPIQFTELWRSDEWSAYDNGMFWTFDPGELDSILGDWPGLPVGASAFARDGFGDLFLLSKGEVYRLDVHRSRIDFVTNSIDFFFDMKIYNPQFKNRFLEAKRFNGARKRLGDLQLGECFAYVPALAIGGTDRVDNVRKVKFLEHLSFLCQLSK